MSIKITIITITTTITPQLSSFQMSITFLNLNWCLLITDCNGQKILLVIEIYSYKLIKILFYVAVYMKKLYHN